MTTLTPSEMQFRSDFYLSTKPWAVFLRHLRMLGIQDEEFRNLHTLGELKRHAKKQFEKLMMSLHPDSKGHLKGHRANGQSYQSVLAAHRWVQALTEKDIARVKRMSETVYEVPLPWHWERPGMLPVGFQEDMSRYHY